MVFVRQKILRKFDVYCVNHVCQSLKVTATNPTKADCYFIVFNKSKTKTKPAEQIEGFYVW